MEPLLETPDSINDKISREAALLTGAAGNLCEGISKAAQDAWSNPERTTKTVLDAAAFGLALAVVARNPAILGKGLQPVCEFGIAHGGKIGAGLLATDLSMRIAGPVSDTWQSANNLAAGKQVLGDRLGAAVIDYTLMSAGGIAGAKYGPTSLKYAGSFIEGSLPTRTRFAFATAGADGSLVPDYAKVNALSEVNKATEKAEVLFNQSGRDRNGVILSGQTRLASPGETTIKGDPGDVVLHHPESGRSYIGAKVLNDSQPRIIKYLKDFDLRDILDWRKFNFRTDEERSFNVAQLQEMISSLKGRLVVPRDLRHHTNEGYKDWNQYRFPQPTWLDKTQPPPVEISISGKVSKGEPALPKTGDLFVEAVLDANGKANKIKGHGAQSGQFFMRGYDECLSAQKFNLWNFLYRTSLNEPKELFRFDSATDMKPKFSRLVETLNAHLEKGDVAEWNYDKNLFEIRRRR